MLEPSYLESQGQEGAGPSLRPFKRDQILFIGNESRSISRISSVRTFGSAFHFGEASFTEKGDSRSQTADGVPRWSLLRGIERQCSNLMP